MPFTALKPYRTEHVLQTWRGNYCAECSPWLQLGWSSGLRWRWRIDVFFSIRKPQGLLQLKTFFERSIVKTNCWTHMYTRTDNGAQLVWRQPLRVTFLFEEPNFYQYRFGLLWENSSWPCSHSSLWASQGLVNRLHKFPCLYSLQPPSCKKPLSFIRNATENPNLSCIHI